MLITKFILSMMMLIMIYLYKLKIEIKLHQIKPKNKWIVFQ
jgi:hypothetical protein